MAFDKEQDFEDALVNLLRTTYGWDGQVLTRPTEEDLLENWAQILFENNRQQDKLGDAPLTKSEMQQILDKIKELRTPLLLNEFINGKSVSIKRDNPDDPAHLGREVSLKIYDRREIAAGQSRYQIARQPVFKTASPILSDRRGDIMLLINGIPVIHIELKKSGVPVSQACNQIEKYAKEGVFSGLFSLVQIFCAMTPEETLYFANPGPEGRFNSDYYFHWADVNNEPINDWRKIARTLLSIPMAHQLIGFYTVADKSDGVLKVMRSYQYYAANGISDIVAKTKWDEGKHLGGFVWHTTGSGKTLTSFKSAFLIADSGDADKVVFLTDRIELGTQSLAEYRGFVDASGDVQGTEDTKELLEKLKSAAPSDRMIVTSIQKMSLAATDHADKAAALNKTKRIVFIVDEAHRSTFGDMLIAIKGAFPRAVFFGFTGTPIMDENQKKLNTTATIFGNEIRRYSIADGINDKNVLGFDLYRVLTFKESDLRRAVALEKAKAKTEEEAVKDDAKKKVYYHYMNDVPMAGKSDDKGNYVKGIEDYIPESQYTTREHENAVVADILDGWTRFSRAGKFHAIFATSSIAEAIIYFRLMKQSEKAKGLGLYVTALFDPAIDNNDAHLAIDKEEGLKEIIEDYNDHFGTAFTAPSFARMKKDMASRLAHKAPYLRIEQEPDKQINILIVVDQMLTGFDSKWVNTLYLDKTIQYENIIQAFSRTNRLFGPDKPFGIIKYYRRPFTMDRNIASAVKLYSGDKPFALFVDKLPENLKRMNELFKEISDVFESEGVENFEKLPDNTAARRKFVLLFNDFNRRLEAAKIQGFEWDTASYEDTEGGGTIDMQFDERIYLILVQRYKELRGSGGGEAEDVPYDLESYITEQNTEKINSDYMNSKFEKYLKALAGGVSAEELKKAEDELHKTFAALTQEEQKYANLFLHDIQTGDARVEEGKSFRDYVTEYMVKAKNNQIHKFALAFGIDEAALRALMKLAPTESTINDYGRYDELKRKWDKEKARAYFEALEKRPLPPPKVNVKFDNLLRKFILQGGIDIDDAATGAAPLSVAEPGK